MKWIKTILEKIKAWWKSKSAIRNEIVIYMATVAELVEKINIFTDKILDKFDTTIEEIENVESNDNEKIS